MANPEVFYSVPFAIVSTAVAGAIAAGLHFAWAQKRAERETEELVAKTIAEAARLRVLRVALVYSGDAVVLRAWVRLGPETAPRDWRLADWHVSAASGDAQAPLQAAMQLTSSPGDTWDTCTFEVPLPRSVAERWKRARQDGHDPTVEIHASARLYVSALRDGEAKPVAGTRTLLVPGVGAKL